MPARRLDLASQDADYWVKLQAELIRWGYSYLRVDEEATIWLDNQIRTLCLRRLRRARNWPRLQGDAEWHVGEIASIAWLRVLEGKFDRQGKFDRGKTSLERCIIRVCYFSFKDYLSLLYYSKKGEPRVAQIGLPDELAPCPEGEFKRILDADEVETSFFDVLEKKIWSTCGILHDDCMEILKSDCLKCECPRDIANRFGIDVNTVYRIKFEAYKFIRIYIAQNKKKFVR